MINAKILSYELRAAGISTHGNCNSAGKVWDDNNNEIQDRPDVAAIIAAHDPNRVLPAEARKSAARAEAALSETLKTATPAQAVAWIDSNVTNIASAKTALKMMARLLIALRDDVMPEIADE